MPAPFSTREISFSSKPGVYRRRNAAPEEFYIFGQGRVSGSDDRVSLYLHTDGLWRYTTFVGDERSGYYASKKEAESMLSQTDLLAA